MWFLLTSYIAGISKIYWFSSNYFGYFLDKKLIFFFLLRWRLASLYSHLSFSLAYSGSQISPFYNLTAEIFLVHLQMQPVSISFLVNKTRHSGHLSPWNLEKKVWRGFDYLFYAYLMRGSQKYQENWNSIVAF